MRGSHPTPSTTWGAILAGGQARRFAGRDKSALLIDGRSILARQVEAFAPVVETIVIVGPDHGSPRLDDVETWPDLFPGRGPLGGLYTVLTRASAARVLVVACDMPFITSDLWRTLASACDGHDAAVPRIAGRWHPLCACYAVGCAAVAGEHLAADRLRMTDLVEALDVVPLDETALAPCGDPARLLANVNTHDDYERLTR